jgi:hypothetical protein
MCDVCRCPVSASSVEASVLCAISCVLSLECCKVGRGAMKARDGKVKSMYIDRIQHIFTLPPSRPWTHTSNKSRNKSPTVRILFPLPRSPFALSSSFYVQKGQRQVSGRQSGGISR